MNDDWRLYAQQVCLEFGDRLRLYREDAGVRQADLATRLGLKRTSIANMESGKQTPSLPQVIAIAQILGLEPADLWPRVNAPVGANAEYEKKISSYQRIRERIIMKNAGDGA